MSLKLYQVILPVPDIDRAEKFYRHLLANPGRRISPGRHVFDCGGISLTCYDAGADGRGASTSTGASPTVLYLAVSDLEEIFERAEGLDGTLLDKRVITLPWGARSFRVKDPFGNPLTFVNEETIEWQTMEQLRGGPEDRLRVGLAVSVQSLQERTQTPVAASIVKIFADDVWLMVSKGSADSFQEKEKVRLQYTGEGGIFVSDTQIVRLPPEATQYLAVAVPAKASMLQRRAAPRLQFELPLSFAVLSATQSRLVSDRVIEAKTREISTGGLRFETDLPLQEGDELRLTLNLSPKQKITASTRVIHAGPVQREDQTRHSVGVQFIELKLDDQVKMLQFLIDQTGGKGLEEESGAIAAVEPQAAPAPRPPAPTPELKKTPQPVREKPKPAAPAQKPQAAQPKPKPRAEEEECGTDDIPLI